MGRCDGFFGGVHVHHGSVGVPSIWPKPFIALAWHVGMLRFYV